MRYFFSSFSASWNLARMSSRVRKISAAPVGIGLLHGRVAVGRRQHEAVDAELRQVGEQLVDLVDVGFLVDGGVGADQEAGRLAALMPSTAALKTPVAFDGQVVRLLQAVEVDVEEEAAGRPELVQPLLDEHAVGAEVDVLAAFEDAAHQLADLRIDQRLAAADADDRGARFVDGGQALLDASAFP